MFADPENRTKVKICGLTTLEDARFSSGALADFLGFIFYPDSPRYIEPAKAGAIINWIEGPDKVGVFVNQPLDDVNSIARQTGVDLVQLHGNESPEYCELVEKPVIKAFHITPDKSEADLKEEIEAYADIADYYLFDSKTDRLWGGTGKAFNWQILKGITDEKPFFLSGGLNTHNISEAIKTVKPFAVDLSSGLEESPGLKDFDKIEAFFEEMRGIWEEQEL
ncbi:phosphoribosylanthranilate isomerase [Rhodohalobacter mucosus]|uniref:N-(5'-phosphoribosyl)anthranilate isomerase n=1 Tax=Rhodohalobacter mucosus TaxID=2079485 RepID=A0A316TVW9_9BACT|nr:phosphoribosylanthranilate isomerase [Rhodohalobacter mucosus]PWN07509.1 phosphoribosylanthranilate isomerase [Rhodohalobacter mucosus]